MNIKILTPEHVIFEGDINSVLIPGKNGNFQIMNNHVAIVSSLVAGKVKLYTSAISEEYSKYFKKEKENESVYSFLVKGGVIEFNHNKAIILCD